MNKRKQKSAESKMSVVAMAKKLCVKKSFDVVSLNAIAKASRVHVTSVYTHFPGGKDDIVFYAYKAFCIRLSFDLDESGKTGMDALNFICARFVTEVNDSIGFYSVMPGSIFRASHAQKYKRLNPAEIAILCEGIDERRLNSIEPRYLDAIVYEAVRQAHKQGISSSEYTSPVKTSALLTSAMWGTMVTAYTVPNSEPRKLMINLLTHMTGWLIPIKKNG